MAKKTVYLSDVLVVRKRDVRAMKQAADTTKRRKTA